jgi:natural product biosynthesis luciferase-like monooxygenase protein/amino acid adenylation domain-containing protein/FkbM family methyltransferase
MTQKLTTASTWGRSNSLVALLRRQAAERQDRGYTYLAQRGELADRLSYADLDERACSIAAVLADSVSPGERALLLYPPGLEFVAGFFGCLYAGVIAVPAYPPHSRRPDPRLRSIAEDCSPGAVLTTSALASRRDAFAEQIPELASSLWLDTGLIRENPNTEWTPRLGNIAFLQYTSGSTGTPKGVIVTHDNLLHNLEMIRRAFGQTAESVVVGWLPLFHDMGLIGNVLQPCYVGSDCVLMSPTAFLQKPSRWLQAIHQFRGTTSGGPNFAYDLCVRSVGPEVREELDLSSWSVAFNGSEPVRAETLRHFSEAFAPCGFRRSAFLPCYGLAEATLFVSGSQRMAEPHTGFFAATALESGAAVPAEESQGRELVSSGRSWMDQRIAVADPESGAPCPEGRVGEVLVAGPSIAAGYWNRPKETEATFCARIEAEDGTFLRTGDQGFLRGGELFLTGRLKDLIILRGRNIYPQDLERTAERIHPALRAGGGAAFSIDAHGEERVVVVLEVDRHPGDLETIAEAVRRAVAEEHGVGVVDVALLRTGTIPKTSSGKIRRRECRSRYLAGALEVLHRSALLQATEQAPQITGRLLTRYDLLDLDPAERSTVLMTWLCDEIARRAGVVADRLAPETMLPATGLDSLALYDLQRRLEADLGLAPSGVPLSELSIAGLRDRLLEDLADTREPAGAGLLPLVPGETLGDHPLAPGQEALWFLEQSAVQEGVLHIAAAARLGTEIDSAVLLRAARALAERHPALRTTFAESAGEPRQRVHASLPPDLGQVDATAWSGEELESALRNEARRRFDLADGPPLRIRIFGRSDGERILLLVLHHLCGDFWSLAVLLRDWAVLYARECGDRNRVHLPELPVSYTDFARWQRRRLAGPERERLKQYWLDHLHGAPLSLELPTDRPRPLVASQRGALLDLRLDPGSTGRVRELARLHGATLFMALLAAFQSLLGRLTGQDDLLVGTPTAGRLDRDLDGVVGYFVNPVPVRARPAADLPFVELLAQTRRTMARALEHRDLPFPELARMLQPVRDPGRPPVFQALFVLQQAAPAQEPGLAGFALGLPGAHVDVEGLTLESLRLDRGTAQIDLTVSAAEVGDTLAFSCEYDTSLFDRATVGRWLRHLQALLDAAAACPERRLGELMLLTGAEQHQLLREWNDTSVRFPLAGTIHGLFAEQVARRPATIAVEQGSERLTYLDLQQRAGRIARRLVAQGLRPEERVAVLAERSPDLVAILLGILQAGGVYLPLDPIYPRERLTWMARDAGASLLIAPSPLSPAELSLFEGLRLIALDGQEPEADPPEVPTEALAYVMYTSGSTGRPKGVAVTHRNVVRLVRGADYADMGPDQTWLQYAPVSFDASTLEIWAPLLNGSRLVLFPGSAGSLDDLARIIETHRVTSAWLTAGLFHEMVDARLDGLQPLTQLLTGGDVVSPEHARRALEAHSRLVLINGYGPTEGTTFTCCHRMTDPRQLRENVPIGRPIANARVYVLDGRFRPVPIGVWGELYAGGEGLARGYLDRPDLTAERFVPNPLAAATDDPGSRLYRTGDLARQLPGGSLEFLSRMDHQVKIRGFRIELGEIEAALVALAGVREAVVVAREDTPGDKRLVAYVVGDGEAGTLRQSLRERLPDYMVPGALLKLAALPLTANGKVDRKALPAPERPSEDGYLAPRTPVEEVLAAVWSELLEVDRVGVRDDFFSLGGHSLKAGRLVSRIRETFAVDLPLRTVFAAPTVAAMAVAIACARSGTAAPAVEIPRIDRSPGCFPLSFAQEQLWFLDSLRPGLAAYHLPSAMRFRGSLAVPALTWGLAEVVRRHEALRTHFEMRAEGPVQIVDPPAPVPLPVTDLSSLDALSRDREVERLVVAEAVRPFDLGSGPLVRASLLRLGSEEHVLLLALHHIGADAWSLSLFVRDLAEFYAASSAGRRPGLPEPTAQLVDFAVWQRRRLQGEPLERLLAFWRGRLEGSVAPLDLPADRVRPPVPSYRGVRLPLTLPSELAARLQTLTRRAGATPYMALLAAFAALLHRYTDRERLAVGSPVTSRSEPGLEGTIGLLLNTLVLPFGFAPEVSFSALLERTRDVVLDAFAHRELPFPVLVEVLQRERDLSRNPLFQVFFALQNEAAPVLELPGLVHEAIDFDPGTAQFDLALHLAESEGGWSGWLEHSTDLFDAATVRRIAGHFLELVRALIDEPGHRVSELPLLTEGERDLLAAWSQRALEEPAEATLHERIEAQVDLGPGRPAVVSADRTLSYAELDRRANRLAHRLLRVGAGPGRRVALCVRRSADIVVALLGILKSGSAYIPLDPEYPGDRLAFMLADAGPAAVVLEEATAAVLPPLTWPAVRLDDPSIESESNRRPAVPVAADDLAYVIYTSGSTGRPKGVMLSHRNVVSFFCGADRRFGVPEGAEAWLATTSISFDISVLELLWPLTRGARVAVHGERLEISAAGPTPAPRSAASSRGLAFSLFFFANDEPVAGDKYRLLLESARFADEHGFEAVWTPERHFHSFGGLYPNPSITSAALAGVTRRVGIRAGSIVLPLHDPIRVAEDWSMVDNLSGGRAGVSFASGWHGDDFVFAPHQYADRRTILYRDLETVRALWRGETITRPGGEGRPVEVSIRPRPVQPELPVWITAAGSPDTFRQAGEAGANLLTHLLGQSLEELAEKIALYRRARRESGHAGAGRVTLMLHTFVGEDMDEVRKIVAAPFRSYLRSSVGLLANHARSLGMGDRLEALSGEDMDALLDHACERYFHTGSLLGTPGSCLPMVERLKGLDVDEVACLIDFGVPTDLALAALNGLAELGRRANATAEEPPRAAAPTIAAAIRGHGVSWLQATPSMARMLVGDPESLAAMAGLRRLLLGGEALPDDLALSLRRALPGVELHNMYGPTETTIWTTTWQVDEARGAVPIGSPLTGEWALVLDRRLQPLPAGVPGELYLGGSGVARGYHERPALTAERFVPDPLAARPGSRLYRTGDLVRRRPDGVLEFLGRVDHQVKVRGHRIEPGEIEVLLVQHPGVAQAVVVARPDATGEASLVAYLVPRREGESRQPLTPVPAAAELLAGHRQYHLPNDMTVAHLSDYQAADAYREIFRDHDYLRHGIRLEDGACIFDIGANIGLFSLFANQTCRQPRIYAFEPMPTTFEVLRTNMALYGLDVALFNHGIADQPANAEFTFYPNAPGMSGRFATSEGDHLMQRAIVRGWLEESGSRAMAPSAEDLDSLLADWFRAETVVCPVRPLSEVIAETGVERIDLLKIDAESSEVDVLRGLSEMDWPKIRQVVAEVHSPELLAGMRGILEPRGFEVATADVASVGEGEDGRPIHIVMLYAVLREEGGVSRAMAPRPAASASVSTSALRAWLHERLPDFMIPAAFVPLDALPLTPNGKIDRQALPVAEGRRPELDAAYVAPSSAVEERIAGIWQEVLGLDRVGMHDNFFELGGNSLSLVQVRAALSSAFETSALSLVDLFRNPTVASLAARLASAGDARVVLDEVGDRGRQQAGALRQGASAVQRQRDFLAERRQRREAKQ